MLSLFISVPLFLIIIINLPFRSLMKRIAPICVLAVLAIQICVATLMLFGFLDYSPETTSLILKLNLRVDSLSLVAQICIGIVLSSSLLVGRYLITSEGSFFNFLNLLLISLIGMNGVVMAEDIFSLYVFIEITAVASYILISFYRNKYALEAAFKYIILSSVATVMMLVAIALFILFAGDTGFAQLGVAFNDSSHGLVVKSAIGLFICALFIKGGLVPFHGWLPDAYSAAPAAVSVFLAGIVTKILGVYTLMRLMISIIGFQTSANMLILFVGALSIIVGALAALGQNDIKRMLAYSSISQVGYILLGLGVGTPLGIFAAIFHLFNHATFKSALFVNSAAIELQAGTRNIDGLQGLSARMPLTSLTSLISSFSAAGIPPFAGFWSKFLIVVALWLTGHYGYAAIAVLASILTLAYFLILQHKLFFVRPSQASGTDIKEADYKLLIPVFLLSLITIVVGITFPLFLRMAKF